MFKQRENRIDSIVSNRTSLVGSAIGARRLSDGIKKKLRLKTGRSSSDETSMAELTDEENICRNIRKDFQASNFCDFFRFFPGIIICTLTTQ